MNIAIRLRGKADYVIAMLSLLWIWIGFYTFDLYLDVFNPTIYPDGWLFNYFHEGIVLALSAIGTFIGLKNKKWNIAFFVNIALFLLMLGNIALGTTKI